MKRYGVRYGRTTKHRRAAIERKQKAAQNCPYCRKPKAKRLSVGIYYCGKCDTKFTGPAYSLPPLSTRRAEATADIVIQEEVLEETIEEQPEEPIEKPIEKSVEEVAEEA